MKQSTKINLIGCDTIVNSPSILQLMGQDVDTSQGEEMENNIQKENLKPQIVLKAE